MAGGPTSSATVLMWDIDGTLLTTARAGIQAWEQALERLVGTRPDLSTQATAGLTDVEIGKQLLERFSPPGRQEDTVRLLRLYEAVLPACLSLRAGRVLPGVREILEAVRVYPTVTSLLLTGNTRAGAAVKLKHYGLASYFADGGFADGAADRVAIARAALTLAKRITSASNRGSIFVIGDTPLDIQCGKAIEAYTIAVATGEYTVAELAACAPWRVLDHLPEPQAFFELIGLGWRGDRP